MKKEEAVNEILDEFDFEKVHKVVVALNWKWLTADTNYDVPTIGDLRKKARKLLNDVINYEKSDVIMSAGGFEARREKYKDVTQIVLKFVVTQWEEEYNQE